MGYQKEKLRDCQTPWLRRGTRYGSQFAQSHDVRDASTGEGVKVYVAGPYSADDPMQVEFNVDKAMAAGAQLLRLGHIPFIPHLTHYFDLMSQEQGWGFTYEDYIAWDDEWLRACDALLYLGPSPGADRELQTALTLGLVTFRDIDDIPPAVVNR